MQIKSAKNWVTMLAIFVPLRLSACSKSRDDTSSGHGASPSLPSVNDSQSGQQIPQATTAGLPQPDAAMPLTKYVNVESGEQLMYLYDGLSTISPNMNEIVEKISSKFRSASDQFKRQDMLKVLPSRIQQILQREGSLETRYGM